jgi:hypothetical protein
VLAKDKWDYENTRPIRRQSTLSHSTQKRVPLKEADWNYLNNLEKQVHSYRSHYSHRANKRYRLDDAYADVREPKRRHHHYSPEYQ